MLENFIKISEYLWEIPKSYRSDMLVPARIYATSRMLKQILKEKAILQLINTATLPGVVNYVLAMPDIHQGYGFPIGGVAAMDINDGVISPGGVGYDINCGVRLLSSNFSYEEVEQKISALASSMQRAVPSGVGQGGNLMLSDRDLDQVLNKGVSWAVHNGYGFADDGNNIEELGCYEGADAKLVSERAKERGRDQLGTLGAGNHFVEIQKVVEIFDDDIAQKFGLFKNQMTVMIHTGSRGLGHQVCTDFVRNMQRMSKNLNNFPPDRELCCVPFKSQAGQEYFAAMAAAANFAWCNRQLITYYIRKVWQQVLGVGLNELHILYDVAHNVAKIEKHFARKLIVHRKGATRSFAPQHVDLPSEYKTTGQPVLIPGSMGTASYVLAGTQEAMQHSFGSACHGAGRRLSRTKANKSFSYQQVEKELKDYGVVVRAGSLKGLIEESSHAYKDIDEVVEVVNNSKLAKKIAKLKPVAIIKG